MNPYITLGILGSIASIISVAISTKSERPKRIHAIYAFVITVLTGVFVINFQSMNSQNELLTNELKSRNSIEHNAARIISTYSSINRVGENRGFILTSFAFLEKNRKEFPETYVIAKDLVINGIKISESEYGQGIIKESDQEDRLKDGAAAMHALLKGLMKSNN